MLPTTKRNPRRVSIELAHGRFLQGLWWVAEELPFDISPFTKGCSEAGRLNFGLHLLIEMRNLFRANLVGRCNIFYKRN